MIKRVNFTGRKRIPRDRVQIEVVDGHPRLLVASINLGGISLLPGAAVFLEAMCAGSTAVQRIRCGEVGTLMMVRDEPLDQIEGENVFFALKVIDQTNRFGRILGIAENLRPVRAGKQTASGRRGILPIEPKDLGEAIWQLDFREHDVFLLVNNKIPGLIDRARFDPSFYAIAYPEIVRCILSEAIDENVDIDEEEDRWPVLWLKFGKTLHSDRASPPTADGSKEERNDWVDDVVKTFCETHAMRTKYLTSLTGSTGGDS